MQGIFQKENTDKALKYGIYRHLPTYEKIIRNLVSFYSKKCKKDELNELWEKERLKKRQYQEKADDEYMESLRLKEIFQHKEDVAKLYEEKTVKK